MAPLNSKISPTYKTEPLTTRLTPRLSSAINKLGDIILPPICLHCQQPLITGNHICSTCWHDIAFISSPFCAISGYPLPFDLGPEAIAPAIAKNKPTYDKARAVAIYKGTMRHLIHKFKYQDKHELTELFTKWMILAGSELIEESDLILPIPLYRWRIWARRFNQSSLIANRLAARCNKPSDNNLLIRHKKTRQQVGLNENQRKKNLSGAFSIAEKTENQVEHKIILLIDDVITTGSTANAAAAVLKRAGAAKVNLLTLASAPKD